MDISATTLLIRLSTGGYGANRKDEFAEGMYYQDELWMEVMRDQENIYRHKPVAKVHGGKIFTSMYKVVHEYRSGKKTITKIYGPKATSPVTKKFLYPFDNR